MQAVSRNNGNRTNEWTTDLLHRIGNTA